MTKKAEKAAQVAANKLAAFNRRVTTLTAHAAHRIPADERTAAFDAGKTAEEFAAEVASREPVGAALFAAKAEAVEYAAEEARKEIAKLREELVAGGWNLTVVAPHPDRATRYTTSGERATARRNQFADITKSDPAKGYQRTAPGEPYYVVMDDDRVARYVERAASEAALYYDKFIVKMVAKVGPCLDARIEGSHVWSHSILTVMLPGEPVRYQRWKTQQIVNYSVYGRAYLQWPSRIVK